MIIRKEIIAVYKIICIRQTRSHSCRVIVSNESWSKFKGLLIELEEKFIPKKFIKIEAKHKWAYVDDKEGV